MYIIQSSPHPETSRRTATSRPIKRRQAAANRQVVFWLPFPATDRPGEVLRFDGLCQRPFRRRPFILLGPGPLQVPIARNLWIKPGPDGLLVKNLYAPPEIEPLAEEIYEAHLAGADVVQALDITVEEIRNAPARLVTRWTLRGWTEFLPLNSKLDR